MNKNSKSKTNQSSRMLSRYKWRRTLNFAETTRPSSKIRTVMPSRSRTRAQSTPFHQTSIKLYSWAIKSSSSMRTTSQAKSSRTSTSPQTNPTRASYSRRAQTSQWATERSSRQSTAHRSLPLQTTRMLPQNSSKTLALWLDQSTTRTRCSQQLHSANLYESQQIRFPWQVEHAKLLQRWQVNRQSLKAYYIFWSAQSCTCSKT